MTETTSTHAIFKYATGSVVYDPTVHGTRRCKSRNMVTPCPAPKRFYIYIDSLKRKAEPLFDFEQPVRKKRRTGEPASTAQLTVPLTTSLTCSSHGQDDGSACLAESPQLNPSDVTARSDLPLSEHEELVLTHGIDVPIDEHDDAPVRDDDSVDETSALVATDDDGDFLDCGDDASTDGKRRIRWDSSLDMPASDSTGVPAPTILRDPPRYTAGAIPVDDEADERFADLLAVLAPDDEDASVNDEDDDLSDEPSTLDATDDGDDGDDFDDDDDGDLSTSNDGTRRIHWDSSLDRPASEPTGMSAPKVASRPRYMVGDIPVDHEAMANDERMAELLDVMENFQREIDGPWNGDSNDLDCYIGELIECVLQFRPIDSPHLSIPRCELHVLEQLLPTMPEGVLSMLFSRLDKHKVQLGLRWELHEDFPDGLPVRRSCRLAKRPRPNYKE